MTIARFYVVHQGEKTQLEATTAKDAQTEVLTLCFSPMELMLNYESICLVGSPPVFDEKESNGPNIGPYGDQTTRKQDWITHEKLYILRV